MLENPEDIDCGKIRLHRPTVPMSIGPFPRDLAFFSPQNVKCGKYLHIPGLADICGMANSKDAG